MDRGHASTPAQRAHVISRMIAAAGEYGMVTALSRAAGVSRQTLDVWKDQGRRALEAVFAPSPPPVATPALERRVLPLLVDGHASERGVQRCLAEGQQAVSVGTIRAVIQQAEGRALRLLEEPLAVGPRVIALDEIYGNNRHGASLSVVDAQSGAI